MLASNSGDATLITADVPTVIQITKAIRMALCGCRVPSNATRVTAFLPTAGSRRADKEPQELTNRCR
jgi:hypothetical protein